MYPPNENVKQVSRLIYHAYYRRNWRTNPTRLLPTHVICGRCLKPNNNPCNWVQCYMWSSRSADVSFRDRFSRGGGHGDNYSPKLCVYLFHRLYTTNHTLTTYERNNAPHPRKIYPSTDKTMPLFPGYSLNDSVSKRGNRDHHGVGSAPATFPSLAGTLGNQPHLHVWFQYSTAKKIQ